ncbi:MAG: sigma-70 family RNA polymerase sigma factor [Rubricoccaceae bacterium]
MSRRVATNGENTLLSVLDLDTRFHQLHNAHADALWRIAGAYAKTRPDREDLFQEMLLHVWRALPSFRGDAAVRTWITRIAFNVALGAVRKRDVRDTVDAPSAIEEAPASSTDPFDAAAHNDALDQLYAALRTLPEVDRALVLLTLEERPHAEIADVLGLSVSNVAVRLHRAKAKLSDLVSGPVLS